MVTPIQQALASSGTAPRLPVALALILTGRWDTSRHLVSMRNQEVFYAVHNAPASSKLSPWDRGAGRTHTDQIPAFFPRV